MKIFYACSRCGGKNECLEIKYVISNGKFKVPKRTGACVVFCLTPTKGPMTFVSIQ